MRTLILAVVAATLALGTAAAADPPLGPIGKPKPGDFKIDPSVFQNFEFVLAQIATLRKDLNAAEQKIAAQGAQLAALQTDLATAKKAVATHEARLASADQGIKQLKDNPPLAPHRHIVNPGLIQVSCFENNCHATQSPVTTEQPSLTNK